MGDRTAFTMTIYDCTDPAEGRAIMELIDEYGLTLDWGTKSPDPSELRLGTPYTDDQANCGIVADLGPRLVAAAPNSSWEIQEDPKYDWLGELRWYTPELGSFCAEGDAQGRPVFGQEAILRLLDESSDLEDARRRALRLTGEPWQQALENLADQPPVLPLSTDV